VLQFDCACHSRTKLCLVYLHRHLSEVRSPPDRLAPNSPMRRTDQDRLVRPNIEPDLGLAPARKAPWRNADLGSLAKLQIAVLRRELDWQPMALNRRLPHISGLRSREIHAALATNVAKRRSKLPICVSASSRSVPAGSPCAVSRNFASNRASSFNSSVPGTPITHWLTLWPLDLKCSLVC
jgi:hypothetical protein